MVRCVYYEVYVWQSNKWELLAHYPSDQRTAALDYAKDIENNEHRATKVVLESFFSGENEFSETLVYLSKIPTTPPKRPQRYSGGNFSASESVKKQRKKSGNMTDSMVTLFLSLIFSVLTAGIITAGIIHLLLTSGLLPEALYRQIILGLFTVFFLIISVPLSIKWVNWGAFVQEDSQQTGKRNRASLTDVNSEYSTDELYNMSSSEDDDTENGEAEQSNTSGHVIKTKRHRSPLFRIIEGLFNLFDMITGKQKPSEQKQEEGKTENKTEETKTKEPESQEEPEQTQETPPAEEPPPSEMENSAEKKEEQKEEQAQTVAIPEEIETDYLKMTAFLAILLRVLQTRNIQLNTYNRFGLELFLAGACERLCLEDKLTPQQNRLILTGLLTILGRTPTLADIFYYKMDEYMLEPKYLPMIKGGTETMRIYLENNSSPELISLFQESMDTWINPDQKEALSSGICTVMFTDMVSSTHLTQVLGDHLAQQLVHTHNAIVRKALQNCGGTEVKHTGDGIMASFLWASNAVDAAIFIQRAVSEYNNQFPTAPLEIRIGLNSGEPIVEDNDLFGQTVQMASRICGQAGANEIYVSSVVKELSAGKNYIFKALGEFTLKGIDEPQLLYEVVWNTPDTVVPDQTERGSVTGEAENVEKETALSETLPEF